MVIKANSKLIVKQAITMGFAFFCLMKGVIKEDMITKKLIVKRVINNNIVIAENFKGQEVVAIGKGLGFKKDKYDSISEHEISKTFISLDNQNKQKLLTLFNEVPYEIIELTEEIIEMAQNELHATFNVSLVIALADHINFSVNQYKQGFDSFALVNEEVKRFYKDEYEVGKKALQMINESLNVNLKKEESTSIAFHLITATENKTNREALKIMKAVSEIMNIVETDLKISLDEDSMAYSRFVIHLKFFMRRVLFEAAKPMDESIGDIFSQIQSAHDEANLCVNKIADYVSHTYKCVVNDDERLYLIIHVERLLKQAKVDQ